MSSDTVKQMSFTQKPVYTQQKNMLSQGYNASGHRSVAFPANLDVSYESITSPEGVGQARPTNVTQMLNDDSILCNEDRPLSFSDSGEWEERKEEKKKRVAFRQMSEEGEKRARKYEEVKGKRRHLGEEQQQPSPPLFPSPNIT